MIEVRFDPLTGHSSRILPERGLMPASDFDLEAFAREIQPSCPFCPGRLEALTPRLPPRIHPEGRIACGEAVLFANLHAYSSHSSVSVYSPGCTTCRSTPSPSACWPTTWPRRSPTPRR